MRRKWTNAVGAGLAWALLAAALPPLPAAARWPAEVAVSTAPGNQRWPAMVTDGRGGAFLAWIDNRDSAATGEDIYIQHLDENGVARWTANGTPVCTAVGEQWNPHPIADGEGGVIVAWQDRRDGLRELYAQRLDSLGAPRWQAGGVRLSDSVRRQFLGNMHSFGTAIASDGASGAIVVWEENVDGFNCDVYAQRVSNTGTLLWTASGLPVCTAYSFQNFPTLVPDGQGGAIVTWEDWRDWPIPHIRAQRLAPDGSPLWVVDGIPVSGPWKQYAPIIMADGAGGAILVWEEISNDKGSLIGGQRVDAQGTLRWGAGTLCVAAGPNYRCEPSLTPDGAGGAIVSWMYKHDDPGVCLGPCANEVYAQHVDSDGGVRWGAEGTPVCTAPGNQGPAFVVTDQAGGAYVAWRDKRAGLLESDLYMQHLDPDGAPLWTVDGIEGGGPAYEAQFAFVTDQAGGAFLAWGDSRDGVVTDRFEYYEMDLYAARVTGAGPVAAFEPPPSPLRLSPPRPNPTRSSSALEFTLAAPARVRVEVFDLSGQRVRVVMDEAEYAAGPHWVVWDGLDPSGRAVPSGLYLVRLTAGGRSESRRIVVLR